MKSLLFDSDKLYVGTIVYRRGYTGRWKIIDISGQYPYDKQYRLQSLDNDIYNEATEYERYVVKFTGK